MDSPSEPPDGINSADANLSLKPGDAGCSPQPTSQSSIWMCLTPSPSHDRKPQRGEAYARETPPVSAQFLSARNPSLGEGLPAHSASSRGPGHSHSAPAGPSSWALPHTAGQNSWSSTGCPFRQEGPEIFTGTDIQTRRKVNCLTLEAVKLEGVRLSGAVSPQCTPRHSLRACMYQNNDKEEAEQEVQRRDRALGPSTHRALAWDSAQRWLHAWASQRHVPTTSLWCCTQSRVGLRPLTTERGQTENGSLSPPSLNPPALDTSITTQPWQDKSEGVGRLWAAGIFRPR